MIETTYRNPLEEQLYSSYIEDLKADCLSTSLEYGYERGMFISVNNYRQTWEQLHSQFRRQYVSIVKSITGKNIHIGGVEMRMRNPPKNLMDIINSKKLVMVAGIHDYHPNDFLGRGRSSLQEFKHTHFYVYGAHHYLPATLGIEILKDQEEKLKKYLGYRYAGRKNKKLWRDNVVSVKAVGMGEYRYTDNVSPTILEKYFMDTSRDTVINYMRNNRHRPSIQYPLYFLWEKNHYDPTSRNIQTQEQHSYYRQH